jgi:glutaredoxin
MKLSHVLRCIPVVASLLLFAAPAAAVDVFLCEDAQGSKSFHDRCPPGTKPVDHRSYRAAGGSDPGTTRQPVTLYMVPNCDSCDQVREFLAVRNIRPVEKNVATNAALQEELKQRAGDLRVPVTVIGDRVVGGYNRGELLDALAAGGYEQGPGASQQGEQVADEGDADAEEDQFAEVDDEELTEPEASGDDEE